MTDDASHRLSTEGADPLLLAGVADANLLELQRSLGVRVGFRGDTLTLTGTVEQIERATPVVQGMIDLARMGETVGPDDVHRLASPPSCLPQPRDGSQEVRRADPARTPACRLGTE